MARKIPLLPLRELIVFPHEVVPLFVGREKSINALEEAMAEDRHILLCAQKKAKVNDPKPEGIHNVGTIGTIIQLLRLPDGTVKVLVEGKTRARIERYLDTAKCFFVEAEALEPKQDEIDDPESSEVDNNGYVILASQRENFAISACVASMPRIR